MTVTNRIENALYINDPQINNVAKHSQIKDNCSADEIISNLALGAIIRFIPCGRNRNADIERYAFIKADSVIDIDIEVDWGKYEHMTTQSNAEFKKYINEKIKEFDRYKVEFNFLFC